MCRAMCRPGVLVQHTWRVGAPVPRTGRREEPARTLLAGFTLSLPTPTQCAPPPRWREDEAFALCALSRSFAPLRPTPALEPELEKAPEGHAATR